MCTNTHEWCAGGLIRRSADSRRATSRITSNSTPASCLDATLKNLGITSIELAEDGKAALNLLEKDHLFDLVMSDMWMPVMDGVELVRRIRGNKRLAHLKVCSITADVEARTAYREHGFDALLLKPVTIEKLSDIFGETGFVRHPPTE